QAEDGIRDATVTGVQTCALPISRAYRHSFRCRYSCAASPSALTITSGIERNAYKPWWNSTALTVYGAVDAPKEVRIGERVTRDWRFDSQTHTVTLTVPDALKNWSVRLAF